MDLYSEYLKAINSFPAYSYFSKSGFVACDNDEYVDGHVLITGINPRKPCNGMYIPTHSYCNPFKGKRDKYFSKLKSFIPNEMIHHIGYLDIFPFYEEAQNTLLSNIKTSGNKSLIAKVLNVTQTEIERINPSLLIIANKSTYSFWGASDDCVWMGYDFETVAKEDLPEELRMKNLDVRIVRGFRQDDLAKREIVYHPEDGRCRLKGTVAVMYSHSRNLTAMERLSVSDFQALYAYSKKVKSQF